MTSVEARGRPLFASSTSMPLSIAEPQALKLDCRPCRLHRLHKRGFTVFSLSEIPHCHRLHSLRRVTPRHGTAKVGEAVVWRQPHS